MSPKQHKPSFEPEDIKKFRIVMKLKQEELAVALGVGVITLSRWENGVSIPSGTAAVILEALIAKALKRKVSLKSLAASKLIHELYEGQDYDEIVRESAKMEDLKVILNKTTKKERKDLMDILGANDDPKVENVIDKLLLISTDFFQYIFKSDKMTYKDILHKVADKLKISYDEKRSEEEIEVFISQKVLNSVWQKLSVNEKEKLELEFKAFSNNINQKGALNENNICFSSLMANQLSSSQIYLASITALGFILSYIGVEISLDILTPKLSSSFLSLLSISKTNHLKMLATILYISALRVKQEGNIA